MKPIRHPPPAAVGDLGVRRDRAINQRMPEEYRCADCIGGADDIDETSPCSRVR